MGEQNLRAVSIVTSGTGTIHKTVGVAIFEIYKYKVPKWKLREVIKEFPGMFYKTRTIEAMYWARDYAEKRNIWFLPNIAHGMSLAESLDIFYRQGVKKG